MAKSATRSASKKGLKKTVSPLKVRAKSSKPRFSVFGRDHSKAKKKSSLITVSKEEALEGMFGSLPFYIRDKLERMEEHYGR